MSTKPTITPTGTLTIGGTAIDLSGSQLQQLAQQALSLVTSGALTNILQQPVSSVPAPGIDLKGAIAFSQAASWNLGEIPLSFSIAANATADVAIATSGALFQYTDGLTNPQQVTLSVPAGMAYIRIEFDVSVNGNLSAQANLATTVGITGSVQAGISFTLGYYKAISPGTTIQDAIIQAVKSFTLPFHSGTLTGLGQGDYLYHNFAGNLALGFGVHYGVSGALISGRSLQEVQQSFTSPIGSLTAGINPTFKASVGLDMTYKHMDLFDMLLHRAPAGGPDTVEVHLFRADKSNFSLTLDAAINVDHGANFNITSNLGNIVDQISASVTKKLPDANSKNLVDQAVHKLFDPATQAVQNFVDDANQKVNGLLQKINDRGIELQASLETQKSRVSLFNYIFDMSKPNVDTAWKAAMKGDFVAAFLTPGSPVTISEGSGIEQEFIRRSSVSLNLFGLLQVSSATQFFSNSSLVYSNGVFNLVFKSGIEWDTTSKNKESIASVTFSASATSKDLTSLQQFEVDLNVQLTDIAKQDAANLSAGVLEDSSMNALQPAAGQARDFIQNNSKGTFALQAALEPSAYAKITASRFNGNKPPALPQTADAQNYAAFVQACIDLFSHDAFGGFPEIARTFSQWQVYNKLGNGEGVPNRRDFPNRNNVTAFWPGSLTDNDRSMIIVYLEAAQRFMNLCDDLSQLASQLPGVDTPGKFNDVADTLGFMVKNDLNIWFTKPMLLALLRISQSSIGSLQSDLGTANGTPQLTVSFHLQ